MRGQRNAGAAAADRRHRALRAGTGDVRHRGRLQERAAPARSPRRRPRCRPPRRGRARRGPRTARRGHPARRRGHRPGALPVHTARPRAPDAPRRQAVTRPAPQPAEPAACPDAAPRPKVWFVGAGPGAADLLTLRAVSVIVAGVHSGDPALWGAVQEQREVCNELGLPHETIPGVSAYSAVAAIAGRELTVPGVAQSVILTRLGGGKTPMPPGEGITDLARHS